MTWGGPADATDADDADADDEPAAPNIVPDLHLLFHINSRASQQGGIGFIKRASKLSSRLGSSN